MTENTLPTDREQLAKFEEGTSPPVIFIGVADGYLQRNTSTPLEAISLFELAQVKPHFLFPANAEKHCWCFLIRTSEWVRLDRDLRIQITNSQGIELGHCTFHGPTAVEKIPSPSIYTPTNVPPNRVIFCLDGNQWVLQAVNIKGLLILEPGQCRVMTEWKGAPYHLGSVVFPFAPPPPLTEERISALVADPLLPKAAKITFGCKNCDSKLRAYAAIKQDSSIETEGFVFYKDLPDRFRCSCGATDLDLAYMRQGMHGMLGREAKAELGEISYMQRYVHGQLLNLAARLLDLVKREKSEAPVQKFLEDNKVLFARFHAKRLFVKPRILGKFVADFAVLDSEGTLVLIELERPNLRLFKSNGHLRDNFNHAYEQVQDWLNEYARNRHAVLEGLDLKQDEVLAVKGCVIAGHGKLEKRDHLRRHMSHPRPGIEFLTFDMLADSLLRIADGLPK